MALAEAWSTTTPPGSENPTNGDDRIREFKRTVEERVVNGGMYWPAGLDQDAGKLACGVQGVSGELDLCYEEDFDVAIQVRDDTHATDASEVEIGDGIAGSRPYTVISDTVSAGTVATAVGTVTEGLTIAGGALPQLIMDTVGQIVLAPKTINTFPYDVLSTDLVLFVGSNGTINLPTSVGNDGRILIIQVNIITTVTLSPFAGDLVAGKTSIGAAGGGLIILSCNETFGTWHVVSFEDE